MRDLAGQRKIFLQAQFMDLVPQPAFLRSLATQDCPDGRVIFFQACNNFDKLVILFEWNKRSYSQYVDTSFCCGIISKFQWVHRIRNDVRRLDTMIPIKFIRQKIRHRYQLVLRWPEPARIMIVAAGILSKDPAEMPEFSSSSIPSLDERSF